MVRRILFTCTGNTCRSPMAELLATAFGPDDVEVWSQQSATGRQCPTASETLKVVQALVGTTALPERQEGQPPAVLDDVIIIDWEDAARGSRVSNWNAGYSRLSAAHSQAAFHHWFVDDPVGGGPPAYATAYGRFREYFHVDFRWELPELPRALATRAL